MTDDKTLRAECEKAWSAYRIAHDQAMSNGQALQEALAENQSLSGRIAVLEGIVEDAYEEGVEDGIGWHAYPESSPRPGWIDSVARVEMLKSARTQNTPDSEKDG